MMSYYSTLTLSYDLESRFFKNNNGQYIGTLPTLIESQLLMSQLQIVLNVKMQYLNEYTGQSIKERTK